MKPLRGEDINLSLARPGVISQQLQIRQHTRNISPFLLGLLLRSPFLSSFQIGSQATSPSVRRWGFAQQLQEPIWANQHWMDSQVITGAHVPQKFVYPFHLPQEELYLSMCKSSDVIAPNRGCFDCETTMCQQMQALQASLCFSFPSSWILIREFPNGASIYRHRVARWKLKPMLPSRHHGDLGDSAWWHGHTHRMAFNQWRCWRWKYFTNQSDKVDKENMGRTWENQLEASQGSSPPWGGCPLPPGGLRDHGHRPSGPHQAPKLGRVGEVGSPRLVAQGLKLLKSWNQQLENIWKYRFFSVYAELPAWWLGKSGLELKTTDISWQFQNDLPEMANLHEHKWTMLDLADLRKDQTWCRIFQLPHSALVPVRAITVSSVMTRRPGHLQRSCLLMHDLVLLCLVWLVPLSFVQGRAWDGNQSARRLVTIRMVQRLPGKPSSADRQAKMLTSQIAKATPVQKLVSILDEVVDGPIFNSIHASAAYKRLEAFKKRGGLRQRDWDDQVLLRLHARVEDMALKGVLGARQTANVLGSLGHLSEQFGTPTQLLAALVESMPIEVRGMIPQHLSNCMWASAKLKDAAPIELEMVPAILAQITNMDAQGLSNCLWASAQLKDVVAPDVLARVSAMAAQIPKKLRTWNRKSCPTACGHLRSSRMLRPMFWRRCLPSWTRSPTKQRTWSHKNCPTACWQLRSSRSAEGVGHHLGHCRGDPC